MDFRARFYEQLEDLKTNRITEILNELNESCQKTVKDWDATWVYEHGMFIADTKKYDALFVLKSEYDFMQHDLLVTITPTWQDEMILSTISEVATAVDDYVFSQQQDDLEDEV